MFTEVGWLMRLPYDQVSWVITLRPGGTPVFYRQHGGGYRKTVCGSAGHFVFLLLFSKCFLGVDAGRHKFG